MSWRIATIGNLRAFTERFAAGGIVEQDRGGGAMKIPIEGVGVTSKGEVSGTTRGTISLIGYPLGVH
jgi:hypothetical protein